MSDYDIVTPIAGAQPIADTSATQLHPLGLIVQAADNASTAYGAGDFIYLKGVASTVVGSFVTYNSDDNSTALLAANAIGPVATAMSINLAGYYGWDQISGKAVGKVMQIMAWSTQHLRLAASMMQLLLVIVSNLQKAHLRLIHRRLGLLSLKFNVRLWMTEQQLNIDLGLA